MAAPGSNSLNLLIIRKEDYTTRIFVKGGAYLQLVRTVLGLLPVLLLLGPTVYL